MGLREMVSSLFVLSPILGLIAGTRACGPRSTAPEHRLLNDADVFIAFIVEEQTAQILPQFLGAVERLQYPKNRTALWIRVEKRSETSTKIVNKWTEKVAHLYQDVNYKLNSQLGEKSEKENHPTATAHEKVILALKEEVLLMAAAKHYNYILFLDSDIMLQDDDLIDHLIDAAVIHRALVVAPLLSIYDEDFANFWGQFSEEEIYIDDHEYGSIINWRLVGCFEAPLVYGAFLVHVDSLRFADLSFNSSEHKYNATEEYHTLVNFSQSALRQGGRIMVCNNFLYGNMTLPADELDGGLDEKEENLNQALQMLALQQTPILPSQYLKKELSSFSKDFDMVYIINLKRRRNRRSFMKQVMYELGVENYKFFDAVDGRLLNGTFLAAHKFKLIDHYIEPNTHRTTLTDGEIGCFFSHYFVWKEALEKGYKRVLILEDDATPVHNMVQKYDLVREDLAKLQEPWDLLYLGRHPMSEPNSIEIEGLRYLVKPRYSYWLVAYALNRRGIEKILSHEPLRKMLPADEYIPILYNQHPNRRWMSQFNPRDLVALSVTPELIFPVHYPDDDEYISDVEHIKPIRRDVRRDIRRGEL